MILFTGYGTLDTAVEAIRQGAFDFLSKPLMDDELLSAIERAVAQSPSQQTGDQTRRQANQQLPRENSESVKPQRIKGIETDTLQSHDPEMQNIFEVIETIADTKTTVLITGESVPENPESPEKFISEVPVAMDLLLKSLVVRFQRRFSRANSLVM